MSDQIIELIREGYEIHLVPLKSMTGLFHPESITHMGITMLKRLPGVVRKGGSCYANGKMPYNYLNSPRDLEIVLQDLKRKVDKIEVVKRNELNKK